MIDKKIDCIGSRETCRYWKKESKKKNLGTSALAQLLQKLWSFKCLLATTARALKRLLKRNLHSVHNISQINKLHYTRISSCITLLWLHHNDKVSVSYHKAD